MTALERFARLVETGQFGLAEAALLVAQDVYPGLDVDGYIGRLDDIAATIREGLPADAFAEQKVVALNEHLFGQLRFAGNVEDYYDPRNSYLNEVIERRTGIPLTLSIVYLEVGRRLGLGLEGVSFPGHFLVKLAVKSGQLVLDPFMGGEAQSQAALKERLATVLPPDEGQTAVLERYLEPASPRQIVARLLRNLKNIYLHTRQYEHALAVMQRMLVVLPESAEELRDRGLLYERLECFGPAVSDLQDYLRRRPGARDSAEIQEKLAVLRQSYSRLN